MGKQWMSGAKLALASGLSQNYLSKRLRNELPFTLNDIDKISQALGVGFNVLLCGPALAFDEARASRSRKTHKQRTGSPNERTAN